MKEDIARILIVDDDEHIRAILKRGLGGAGYECFTTQSGEYVSEILQQSEFDLVLLEIGIPGKSGMELLSNIKAQCADVAVVMLTDVAEVSTAVSAMRSGAYDYVTKPISVVELAVRIEGALSRRALLLENRAYQRKLEQLVDELNARQEQSRRELTAMKKLFESYLGEGGDTVEAYAALQEALIGFASEVERLADGARIIGPNSVGAGAKSR